MVNPKRVRKLNKSSMKSGPVLYWMSRDQRIEDNWALHYATEIAQSENQPLVILFCLRTSFLKATLRQYSFMLEGLKETVKKAKVKNIPFYIEIGESKEVVTKFVNKYKVGTVITDFSPLRSQLSQEFVDELDVAFLEVDAHNIVPVWVASDKQEFAARTIRPKIENKLDEFLVEYPSLAYSESKWKHKIPDINWALLYSKLKIDRSVKAVDWLTPGFTAAKSVLTEFIENKINLYDIGRNDPNQDVLSNMSPYYHFGQFSTQRAALIVQNAKVTSTNKEAYLEEMIIRRELSENYCFYNPNYKRFSGFPNWAQKTLNKHRKDIRDYSYSLAEFEGAQTHDDLWNAAQKEMVSTGKMHGYMRMYWAKKILEWTESPEIAQEIAIYLNDKYQLDGRDPNGYVGIAWSIGAVHDRAWFERDIFGKVRYMNANGARRKFDVTKYIAKQAP